MKNQKETLNVENLSDDQLLNLDLDSLNQSELIKLINSNKTLKENNKVISKSSFEMYKGYENKPYEEMNKADKTKFKKFIRKQRNKFFADFVNASNEVERKKVVKEFISFYKKYYTLNDFSVRSICRGNSDKNTLVNAKVLLSYCQKSKIK